jgi:hypothetical protein
MLFPHWVSRTAHEPVTALARHAEFPGSVDVDVWVDVVVSLQVRQGSAWQVPLLQLWLAVQHWFPHGVPSSAVLWSQQGLQLAAVSASAMMVSL